MGVWFFCTFVYLRYLIIGNKKYNGREGPISNSNYKNTSGLKNVKHKRSVWKNLLYTFEGLSLPSMFCYQIGLLIV